MCNLFDLIKDKFDCLRPEWHELVSSDGFATYWFTNRHFNNQRFYVIVRATTVSVGVAWEDLETKLYADSPSFLDDLCYEIENVRSKGLVETDRFTRLSNGDEDALKRRIV